MQKLAQKAIAYSFYLLFFLVPLWFYAGSSELFEYNKMMLTYGLTVIIVAAWVTNWLLKNRSLEKSDSFLAGFVRRTPLDIPILLYLLSHLLSTIFSLDPHTSIWGYYSRFHEGLLATFSYIILYYAAVSNLNRSNVIRILQLSLLSGAIVSIYGAFEHFGHSPSCLFITGKFDVDCWVQDVKNRVFATLGQPNWMAAYLDVLILVTLGLVHQFKISNFKFKIEAALGALLFSALLFTKSRSGILGLAAGLLVFVTIYVWRSLKEKTVAKTVLFLTALAIELFLISGIFGLPFNQTEKFSLENLLSNKPSTPNSQPPTPNPGYIDIGISESGDIRRIVWQGAIKVWQRYPIFGSGVETFAYAYYQDRPVTHNMVSEWDFLYNKAHNELLNILATTGTVGFLSYLSILVVFSLWFIKNNLITREAQIPTNSHLITTALFAAWVSILVTNFFGFSVVIIGLFFFLIPAFCLILSDQIPTNSPIPTNSLISTSRWVAISLICLVSLICLTNLINMWLADRNFAYGKNLDSVQHFSDAYKYLSDSVSSNPGEPTFRDELSYNQSVLAGSLFTQLQAASDSAIASLSAQQKLAIQIPQLGISTQELVQQAIINSDKVIETSPNVLTFWKTRTKVFYQLATVDNKYTLDALAAIERAAQLAPTDAKVHYNLGILLGRTGQITPAIKVLEETTELKSDYRDAFYALGLYYKETGDIVKARKKMQYILSKIGPDSDAQKFLDENK